MPWFPCNIGGGSPQYQEYDEGYFVETVSKTSGSASIKIIKQSADGTKEETVYTQSDASSEIEIDGIFKFQYTNSWYFTLLQTIDGFKKGDAIGWEYNADADFFVITKYSWTANYEWLYNSYGGSKPTVTLTGRTYFKVYPHQTLIGYVCRNSYTSPLYVSTYKKACVFNTGAGGGPFTNPTEFEYKGKTWYVCTSDYAMGGDVTDSSAIAIKIPNQSTMIDGAKYLIDNSGLRWMNESPQPTIANIVTENAKVSDKTEETYVYPTYSDISNYDSVVIKVYTTVSDIYYENYVSGSCDRLPLQFSNLTLYDANGNTWNQSFNITIGSTSITQIAYTGSWEDVYIDIIGINQNE